MWVYGFHRINNFMNFFSISKHKANTTELHPKVRQTCLCTESIFRNISTKTFGSLLIISQSYFISQESGHRAIIIFPFIFWSGCCCPAPILTWVLPFWHWLFLRATTLVLQYMVWKTLLWLSTLLYGCRFQKGLISKLTVCTHSDP